MRNAFADELTSLAGEDEKLVLLAGDIGNRLFNTFKERYPGRFVNCGVAEANMTGVAAGMALCGLHPVTYTIATFNSYRCLEQIRLDVCYQNVPVVIVGTGGGLSYAPLNATHQALEDVACLRALPNMTVLCPADPWEVRALLRAALRLRRPVYLRIGKKGEPCIHSSRPELTIGKATVVRKGRDVCLIGSGTPLPGVLSAADLLQADGISAEVVSFHTVKPLDTFYLTSAFERFSLVTVVEEHSIIGGLGGSVAEWLADHSGVRGRLLRIGSPDSFLYEAASREWAHERFGLTPRAIAERVRGELDPVRRGMAVAATPSPVSDSVE